MNDVYEQHRQRMAEQHGLRPSNARECPRVVAGKRCRSSSKGEFCICNEFSRVLDHRHMWLDGTGDLVLTAEPYSVHGDDLFAFVTAVGALGLEVRIIGRSPWNPGSTVLLYVKRR